MRLIYHFVRAGHICAPSMYRPAVMSAMLASLFARSFHLTPPLSGQWNNNNNNNDCISRAPFHGKQAQLRWTSEIQKYKTHTSKTSKHIDIRHLKHIHIRHPEHIHKRHPKQINSSICSQRLCMAVCQLWHYWVCVFLFLLLLFFCLFFFAISLFWYFLFVCLFVCLFVSFVFVCLGGRGVLLFNSFSVGQLHRFGMWQDCET